MCIRDSLFSDTGMQISCEGQRHLGAVIGSESSRNDFVTGKVKKWVKDIEVLSKIGINEPQVALSAFTKGICHRWSFIQRTIPDIKDLFEPLEEAIREIFIPAIIGRKISDLERKIFSLLVRFGGMGIPNPVQCADREYGTSVAVTKNLTHLIINQERDLRNYNLGEQDKVISSLKTSKDDHYQQRFNDIIGNGCSLNLKRSLQLNQQKGVRIMAYYPTFEKLWVLLK